MCGGRPPGNDLWVREQFSLNLLGDFAVYRGMRPIILPPSCQRVVALAALKRRRLHRTWVCATLWPYAPPAKASASLRSALWRLRPLGAEPLLDLDAGSIGLAPNVSVDWYHATDALTGALGGARRDAHSPAPSASAELLDGWPDPWCVHERRRFQAMRVAVENRLATMPETRVAGYPCGTAAHDHNVDIVRSTNDQSEP